MTDLEGSVHVDSWAPDGSALAFQPRPSLEVGTPPQLFQGTFLSTMPGGSPRPQYDVTADGQRFLMLQADTSVRPRIIVVQNWTEELKRLVPVR